MMASADDSNIALGGIGVTVTFGSDMTIFPPVSTGVVMTGGADTLMTDPEAKVIESVAVKYTLPTQFIVPPRYIVDKEDKDNKEV